MTYLATTLATDQAAACGETCACHGDYTCARVPHPADSPHVGVQADGSLVQWHTGECLTAEQVAAAEQVVAEQRKAAALALLDQIDPAVLVAALRAGGHL